MNTPITVGHVGWSPDYKSTPMPPETGEIIARRSAAACSPGDIVNGLLHAADDHPCCKEALYAAANLLEEMKNTIHQRNQARILAAHWRDIAAGPFAHAGKLPWEIDLENAERMHGGAGLSNQPETPTPLDGASC